MFHLLRPSDLCTSRLLNFGTCEWQYVHIIMLNGAGHNLVAIGLKFSIFLLFSGILCLKSRKFCMFSYNYISLVHL